MPLTVEEKNLIAQGSGLAVRAALPSASPLVGGTIGLPVTAAPFAALPFLSLAPPIIGLASLFGRQRFPKGPTGREIFDPVDSLRARGLDPRLSRDPFFGDLVVSTRDQGPFLSELVRNAAVRRVAAQEDFSDILTIREGVIQGLAETAQERGFSRTIDQSFRGGVFRRTADDPLQLVER